MKITIECTPKEIAALTLEPQGRQKQRNMLETQMELISKSSKYCESNGTLIQNIPALTHAMVEISQHLCSFD